MVRKLKIPTRLNPEIREAAKYAVKHINRCGYIEKLGHGVCQKWVYDYIRAMQVELMAYDHIIEFGLVTGDRFDSTKKSPAFQMWQQSNATKMRMEKNMNMTGFDYERSNITLPDTDDGPDFTQ